MIPGDVACITEFHFGVGSDGTSYILTPGDGGLIVERYHEFGTVILFMLGNLIEVEEQALSLREYNNREIIK